MFRQTKAGSNRSEKRMKRSPSSMSRYILRSPFHYRPIQNANMIGRTVRKHTKSQTKLFLLKKVYKLRRSCVRSLQARFSTTVLETQECFFLSRSENGNSYLSGGLTDTGIAIGSRKPYTERTSMSRFREALQRSLSFL